MMMMASMAPPVPTSLVNTQPTSSFFLNSICPINQLDLNNRWPIPDEVTDKIQYIEHNSVSYKLNDIALNIPRTVLQPTDSNTYISLPHSTWSKFKHCQKLHGEKLDGLIIGANVNGLAPDPFKLVHLNPGCITLIIENPLYKPKQTNKKSTILKVPKSSLSRNTSTFIIKTLTCDNFKTKFANSKSIVCSSHGRVFNLISLNDKNLIENVEIPLMRITFQYTITAVASFQNDHQVDYVIGFNNGDIIWVNPIQQKYTRMNKNGKLINDSIISITWSLDGDFIHVGFLNGEIAIFNRDFEDCENYTPNWIKNDKFMKKSFLEGSNPIKHFKISNKAITMIKMNPVNENLIGVTSDDGFTRLIDLSNNYITDIIQSYFGAVFCLDFSDDGRFLAVGGQDDLISIYHISNLSKIRLVTRLRSHNSWIRSVRFFKNENNITYRLCSLADDGKLIFWDFCPKSLPKIKTKNKIIGAPQQSQQQQQKLKKFANDESVYSNPSSTKFSIQYPIQTPPQHEFHNRIHHTIGFKNIPIIIPILEMDLGVIYEDCRLFDFYIGPEMIWVFGKNGDCIEWLRG